MIATGLAIDEVQVLDVADRKNVKLLSRVSTQGPARTAALSVAPPPLDQPANKTRPLPLAQPADALP
jgi:hypothetical protein